MILFMGLSGAGKGTQSTLIATQFGYAYLSTGDMLRQHATPAQKEHMLAGKLLADDEIIEVVDKALRSLPDANKTILDGFPRTPAQASWLLGQSEHGRFTIDAVFNLDVTPEVVFERLQSRGRSDDTEAAIAERIQEYKSYTAPVLVLFKGHGVEVYDIDASQDIAVVHREIMQHLEKSRIVEGTYEDAR